MIRKILIGIVLLRKKKSNDGINLFFPSIINYPFFGIVILYFAVSFSSFQLKSYEQIFNLQLWKKFPFLPFFFLFDKLQKKIN